MDPERTENCPQEIVATVTDRTNDSTANVVTHVDDTIVIAVGAIEAMDNDGDDDGDDGDNDGDDGETEMETVRLVPFPEFVNDPFVISSNRFLDVMKSMHKNEEAFAFRNRSGDIQWLFRSSAEMHQSMMVFELVVPYDPVDDPTGEVKALYDAEYACVEDEAGDYIFETLTIPLDSVANDNDELDEIVDIVNYYYNVSICECGNALVKTGDFGACFQCHAQAQDGALGDVCMVCSDDILTRHGRTMLKCCGQTFHRKCLQKWCRANSSTCPVCRK